MFFYNALNRPIVSQATVKNIVFIQDDVHGYKALSSQVAIKQINKYLLDDGISNLNLNSTIVLDIIYQYCNFYAIEKFASISTINNFMKEILRG